MRTFMLAVVIVGTSGWLAPRGWCKEALGIVRLARQERSLETTGKIQDVDVDAAAISISDAPPLGEVTERPAPAVKERPLHPRGTIDRSTLAKEVAERFRDLELCRARVARVAGVALDQVKAGELTLRWTITARGGTRGTLVLERTETDLPIMKCIRRRMNAWQFSPPKGGVVQVSYDYQFS